MLVAAGDRRRRQTSSFRPPVVCRRLTGLGDRLQHVRQPAAPDMFALEAYDSQAPLLEKAGPARVVLDVWSYFFASAASCSCMAAIWARSSASSSLAGSAAGAGEGDGAGGVSSAR